MKEYVGLVASGSPMTYVNFGRGVDVKVLISHG